MNKRQMHLIAVLLTGPHTGRWQSPKADNNFLDVNWWTDLGKTLERGKFDAIFFADHHAWENLDRARVGSEIALLDPMMICAAIAGSTSKLGLGLTVSTSVYHPHTIARTMQTLDQISGGRAAWNVVTSAKESEPRRVGQAGLLPKDERYDMADEALEVCFKLWESFPADAYLADRKTGHFIDVDQLKHFTHDGKYFKTEGPLTVPPSRQGHPVIMQAGSSPRGREFAARWAELVFTYQRTAEGMHAFRQDMSERLVRAGRSPGDCAFMPSVQVVIGETESIAQEKREYIFSQIDEATAMSRVSNLIGIDPSTISGDAKIDDLVDVAPPSGARDVFLEAMAKDDLTVLETARRFAYNDLGPEFVGTAEQVADQMQTMFETWGNDGFILNPGLLPESYEEFVRAVVPILQERGVYREDYEGTTLREHIAQGRA